MIESFRNRLWADYKTGAGIEPALLAQFHPLEEALAAMGVVVWPMIELEADDALASAAHLAAKDKKVEKVAIWTPDKDLAQCVRGTRVVQIDGRRKIIRDAAGIREKFGVDPPLIPDLLALVGDAADGYPGIPGIGARTAAQLLNRYGQIENFPPNVLGEQRELALLFKKLATLRTDAPLFKKVETLRWRGPTPAFAAWAEQMKAPRLLERCEKAAARIQENSIRKPGSQEKRIMWSGLKIGRARAASEIAGQFAPGVTAPGRTNETRRSTKQPRERKLLRGGDYLSR